MLPDLDISSKMFNHYLPLSYLAFCVQRIRTFDQYQKYKDFTE